MTGFYIKRNTVLKWFNYVESVSKCFSEDAIPILKDDVANASLTLCPPHFPLKST